ncbi:MAG: hypothetical protein ABSB49_21280, partial [Polyangia bacterium]
MTTQLIAGLLCLLSATGVASAAEVVDISAQPLPGAAEQAQPIQPETPMPTNAPPAPPPMPPAAPTRAQVQPSQLAAPAPADQPAGGQWVYTGQYGWVYMPYGDQYVYEGVATDPNPYAYVYYPSYGWSWLAAPWLWGWGPYPYFGVRGALGFGWYRGLYRAGWGWGGYRGEYGGRWG